MDKEGEKNKKKKQFIENNNVNVVLQFCNLKYSKFDYYTKICKVHNCNIT
jgi:hypothetical protein